jgi:hypothetical protein
MQAVRFRFFLSILTFLTLLCPLSLQTHAWAEEAPPFCKPSDHCREYSGVQYKMIEIAKDGIYSVESDRIQDVDANSDLLIQFSPQTDKEGVELPKEALEFIKLLQTTKELYQQRATLNKSYLLDKPADVLIAERKALNKRIAAYNKQLKNAIPDKELRNDIRTGKKFAENKGNYGNVAQWLRSEINKLGVELDDIRLSGEKHTVTVQGFHDSQLHERRPVHVDNYDRLPIGEYRPIDRYGLSLTPAEQELFNVKLKQAEVYKDFVEDVQQISKEMKNNSNALLQRIKTTLAELEAELEALPTEWEDKITDELEKLGDLRTPGDSTIGDEITAIKKELKAFKEDQQKLDNLKQTALNLRDMFKTAASHDLQRVFAELQALQTQFTQVKDSVSKWDDRIRRVEGHIKTIAESDAGSEFAKKVKTAMSQDIQQLLQKYEKKFLASWEAFATPITNIHKAFTENAAIDQGVATIAEMDSDSLIARPTNNLLNARIELPRVGINLNDHITTRVMFWEGEAQQPDATVKDETLYKVRTRLMGLYRAPSAHLVFARAQTGTEAAKKWKPNVAATMNWYYRVRETDPQKTYVWNTMNIGWGIHLANLDMGEDSVEFGAGFNLALFSGLVTLGYGWNLNLSEDQEYYFIGIDLFDLLNPKAAAAKLPESSSKVTF